MSLVGYVLMCDYVNMCSRYVNEGRMYVSLNGEPLKEVDCFDYLES